MPKRLTALTAVVLLLVVDVAAQGARTYRPARQGGNYMHNYYFAPAPSSTPWAPAWSPDGRTIAIAMMVGRFAVIVPMLAVAGSLAAKRKTAASAGTFPTHGGLFVGLLVGAILIVGGLTFLPALALGPIAEHFAMLAGTLF